MHEVPRRLAWALLCLGAVVLLLAPLALNGAAYLYTDERYAHEQAHSLAHGGGRDAPVLHAELVGNAFAPMGSSATNEVIAGGVTPTFVWFMSLGATFGPTGVQVQMALVTLALLGVLLVLNRQLGGVGSPPAVFVLALSAPPILFWSTFGMANLPTATAFLAALAALTAYAQTSRTRWLTLSLALLLFCVALRKDTLGFLAAYSALIALLALRRPALWIILAGILYAGLAAYRYAVGLARTFDAAFELTPESLRIFFDHVTNRYEGYHPPFSWSDAAYGFEHYLLGLYPVLVIGGVLGVLLVAPRTRAGAFAWLGFVAVALVYAWSAFTIPPTWGEDPPGVMSSLVRYGIIVPILLVVGLAAAIRWSRRAWRTATPTMRRAAAVLVTLVAILPAAVTSAVAEPGFGWLQEQRDWRSDQNDLAARLPENAFLIGDEQSKFIVARPVLTPFNAYHPLDTYLPPMIDRLADRAGLRAFIYWDAFYGDWSGKLGEYVTDEHHVTMGPGVRSYLEVLWTNTSLRNVGILTEGEWELTPEGLLRATSAVSTFRVTPVLQEELREAPSPGLRVELEVRDTNASHALGYTNAPHLANDARVAHAWQGGGSGAWRTIEVFLPADTVVNGAFFVSGDLTLRALRVTPVGAVVEP